MADDDDTPKEEHKEEETVTPPPPPPPANDSDLREAVTKLTDTVNGILERLEQNAPVTHENDETPTSKPWTHKGSWK